MRRPSMQGWPEPKTAERLGDMIIRCFPRRLLRQKGKKETCEHLLTFIEKSFLDVHSMYCAHSRSSRIPEIGWVLVSMDGFQIVGWILNSQGCNNIRILDCWIPKLRISKVTALTVNASFLYLRPNNFPMWSLTVTVALFLLTTVWACSLLLLLVVGCPLGDTKILELDVELVEAWAEK